MVRYKAAGILLALASISAAAPMASNTDASIIQKRNPCDGVNASPLLYHEYREDSCPALIKLNPDGSCPIAGNPTCSGYCQVRTNFYWGTEVPFPNTYCHGPFTCTITDTHTTTVTWNFNGNGSLKIKDILTLGISGGFSTASADAHAKSTSVKLDSGSCGYFTYVPVQHDSCGTLTQGENNFVGGQCINLKTTGNYCTTQFHTNSDGSLDGDTIFIKTDCNTREPLPADQQDPVYRNPNVPLDRTQLMGVLNSMGTENPTPPYAQGTCSLHLTQWDYAWGGPLDGTFGDGQRYQVEVTMLDNSKAKIGYQARTDMGDPGSFSMNSKLEAPLIIQPESQGNGDAGYIQFSLPNQSWPSDHGGTPGCTMGAWDGSNTPAYRQMDCSFYCGWGGGPSSDGS